MVGGFDDFPEAFVHRAKQVNKLKKTYATTGETEWTKNGRYTGKTDIELTLEGERQVESTAKQLVGPGKLIDPARVARVWVSPRKRAQQTFRLLFRDGESEIADTKVTHTEDIAEWDYGDYEGLVVDEIIRRRSAKGMDQDRKYNIWRDGCEGGEYAFYPLFQLCRPNPRKRY